MKGYTKKYTSCPLFQGTTTATYYSFLWEDFSPQTQTPFTLSFCVFSFCSISCSRVVGIDGWLMIHSCHRLHSSICIFSVQSAHSKLHLVPKFIRIYY